MTDEKLLAKLVEQYKQLEPLVKQAEEILAKRELTYRIDPAKWPKATYEHLSDWSLKFQSIKDAAAIPADLIGKNILLYGCNDPYLTNVISEYSSNTVLYNRHHISTEPNVKQSSIITEVKQYAPFDLVIYWDVLDHYFDDYYEDYYGPMASHLTCAEAQEDLLNIGLALLNENGKIFVRCHPWYSRHGGHLKSNVAFKHLLVNDTEYQDDLVSEHFVTHRIFNPVQYYVNLFRRIKLKKVDLYVRDSPLEDHITDSLLEAMRYKWLVNTRLTDDEILSVLKIEYVDCLLH